MKKISLLNLGTVAAIFLTGCAVQSSNPNQPATFADKGSYFQQDKTKSLASNLVAFSGYPGLISDHDMPSDLKAGLDFTSGAYMGFNGFGSLFGAGGIGLLSMVSDNTLPYQHGVAVVMVKMQSGEKYNDMSVAERAIEESFNGDNVKGIHCRKASAAWSMTTDIDAFCDLSGDGSVNDAITVRFARSASGNEFPELGTMPIGDYGVMLLSNLKDRTVKDNAWVATYDHNGFMQFKNLKLPFLSPDKSGKRIAFATENGKESVIYK